jgi:RNA polymerase sigma-70 factor (ECF subfamily)
VVQDACIKILNRKKDNEIKDLKSYVSVAIRNLSLKKIQSSKRFKDLPEDREWASALSHEEYLIDEENRVRLQKAVNVLPNKSKKVFELCVLEGIKYKNTAEVLGISINTVKFHLKKSFKLLRLELQDAF